MEEEGWVVKDMCKMNEVSLVNKEPFILHISITTQLSQDVINPAHGSLLRVNSPSHEISSNMSLLRLGD